MGDTLMDIYEEMSIFQAARNIAHRRKGISGIDGDFQVWDVIATECANAVKILEAKQMQSERLRHGGGGARG